MFLVLFLLFLGSLEGKVQLSRPIKALYIDSGIDWNNPANTVKSVVDSGYNVVLFAFYTTNYGPLDMATAWSSLDSATKQNTVNYAHSKGAVLMVSFGGDSDASFWTKDPVSLGTEVGSWAKSQLLDGVDYDLEGFSPSLTIGNKNSQQTISWLISLHNATKNALGADGFVSGAPQAPYIGAISPSSSSWAGPLGAYSAVYASIPLVIDFFFVQFYNQGSCYTDYNGLMISSGSPCGFPGTAFNEIVSYGIPSDKIIIGKPMISSDASNGFVSPSALNTMVKQYNQTFGIVPSFGAWQHHSGTADSNWINAIYGSSPTTTSVPPSTTTSPRIASTAGTTGSTSSSTTTGSIRTSTTGSTNGSTCSNNCSCTCQCF